MERTLHKCCNRLCKHCACSIRDTVAEIRAALYKRFPHLQRKRKWGYMVSKLTWLKFSLLFDVALLAARGGRTAVALRENIRVAVQQTRLLLDASACASEQAQLTETLTGKMQAVLTSVVADVIDAQHGDVVREAHAFVQVWWQCHACGQHGIGRLSVRHFDLPDACAVCAWTELRVSIKERDSGDVFVSEHEVVEVEDASLDI